MITIDSLYSGPVAFNLFVEMGHPMNHSSSSRTPCSHISTGELKFLSIMVFVKFLVEPMDCIGRAHGFHGTQFENHYSGLHMMEQNLQYVKL